MSDDYWRRFFERGEAFVRWATQGRHGPAPVEPEAPQYPPLPDDLRGLTCGARTRAGTPCKRTDIYESGRCRFHGGLSTGPRTVEGKRRAARNGKLPKRKAKPMDW